jgi:hypothetical protein
MVIDEHTESGHIAECLRRLLPVRARLVHRLAAHEHVPYGEEQGVVKGGGKWSSWLLETGDERHVSVEHLADLVDSCCLGKLGPEPLGYLGDGVDTNSIDTVVCDEVLDPGI